MYRFRLYVAAKTPISVKAIMNLRSLLNERFRNIHSLEIINVTDNPQLAQKEGIFATPTMVKLEPPPVIRIIGDFSSKEKVLPLLLG